MSYLDINDPARQWLAEHAEHIENLLLVGKSDEAQAIVDSLPEVYVWPAMLDQCYGGPEEGGWWYDVHDPIPVGPSRGAAVWLQDAPRGIRKVRLDLANATVRRANALSDKFINAERPSISNTNSRGVVVWVWTFDAPCHYPKERPRYE